jgi:N,N'-diacetyllegionaminate synthase
MRRVRERGGLRPPLPEWLTLLHCTSTYPTALDDVNLRAMETLREVFGLPVGYSDHTNGTLISIAAVALGAVVLEKHFTLDNRLAGPDHQASIEPAELAQMVVSVRSIERSLGSGEKAPCASELPIRELVRRSVILKRALKSDDLIAREDLVLLRPGDGIPPREVERLIGKRVNKNLPEGTMLQWSDVVT